MNLDAVYSDDSDGSRGYVSDFQGSPNCDAHVSPRHLKTELSNNDVYLEIVEQPGDFRYRYEKEKYHGHILGENSPQTKKKDLCKFPSVKIHNYESDAIVRCWLITADLNENAKAHVHKLCRKVPKGQMQLEPHNLFATVKNDFTATFDYMYIVHAVGAEESDLKIYETKKNWLKSGSFNQPPILSSKAFVDSEELKQMNKNQSILLFQAFDAHTKEKICESVVSRKIKNLHNAETAALKITNYSLASGSCSGGDTVFMLVEKISKDVEVRFFSLEPGTGRRIWEDKAKYGPQHIHHQYAIVFETPKYCDTNIVSSVNVFVELYRTTDGSRSEPVPFTYQPVAHYCNNDFSRKRPHTPEEVLLNNDVLFSGVNQSKRQKENISPDPTSVIGCNEISSEITIDNDLWLAELLEYSNVSVMQSNFDYLDEPVILDCDNYNQPDLSELIANSSVESDSVNVTDTKDLPVFDSADSYTSDVPASTGQTKNERGVEIAYSQSGIWTAKPEMAYPQSGICTAKPEMAYAQSGIWTIKPETKIIKTESTLKQNLLCLRVLHNIIICKPKKYLSTFGVLLKRIINRGFNINTTDFSGNSLFLLACLHSKEAVSVLLDFKEINREIMNLAGDSALHCATRMGKIDIVEELINHNFDTKVKNYKSGDTPLHIAVVNENLPLIKLLIKFGADPLQNNFSTKSAYDYSASSDSEDLKKYLFIKAQESFRRKPIKISPSSTYFSDESALTTKFKSLNNYHLKNCQDLLRRYKRWNVVNHQKAQKGHHLFPSSCNPDDVLGCVYIAEFLEEQLFFKLKQTFSTQACFTVKGFQLHKLDNGPSTEVTLNKEDALTYYRQMQTIRRLETVAGNLYKEKLVRGFCHLYSGQEACAVGMKASMRPVDSLISAYRVHGWTYLIGQTAFEVLSELVGMRTGTSRGKGGSMHMYGRNFYGGNGIVGAQVPLGAGVALAAQYLKTGGVCFSLYGDGAANQGQVFEAFNMAKLWNLPCIFVCENNGYAMGTSVIRSTASTDYYTRGDYVPGIRVDGMDVLAVREASKFAINFSVEKGPIILELVTYRYSGHSMSDPGTSYRTRDEVQGIRQTRDPIASFREKILSTNLVPEEELKAIDGQLKKEIDMAESKARAEKPIGIEELTGDVYVDCCEDIIRNISPWDPLKHKRISDKKFSQ